MLLPPAPLLLAAACFFRDTLTLRLFRHAATPPLFFAIYFSDFLLPFLIIAAA